MRRDRPSRGRPRHPLAILALIVLLLLAVYVMFGPPMPLERMLWLEAAMVALVIVIVLLIRATR